MSTDRSTAIIFTPGRVQAGAIDPNAIPSPGTDAPRHALAWTTNINMRPVDHDTIQWDAGSVEFSDGVTQAVANGNSPITLSPDSNNGEWYVYKRFSSSALQFTQGFSTAIGTDRVFMGIVVVSAETENSATVIFRGGGGIHISAQSISVGTLSAIAANLGSVETGTMTGVLIRTSASGSRIELSENNKINFFYDLGGGLGSGPEFADIEPVPALIGKSLRIRTLGVLSDLILDSSLVRIIGGSLDLSGNNINDVGDLSLDSLTKDGDGHIDVRDDVDFNNNRILNAVLETVESDDPTASLSASSTSITAGSSVVLSWSSANGVSASINQGVGAVAPVAGGTVSVTPASTRTYTLTVVGAEGTNNATASVTITVIPAESNPPTVDSFTATPNPITEGESTLLEWETTGATSVSIPGVGSNLAVDGSATVSPTASRDYILTATNDDGSTTRTRSVTVNPAAALPTIDSFSVSPDSVPEGGSVTVAWQTTGATSVQVQRGIVTIFGSTDWSTISTLLDGSTTHTPSSTNPDTTRYRIRATNASGTVTESETITNL